MQILKITFHLKKEIRLKIRNLSEIFQAIIYSNDKTNLHDVGYNIMEKNAYKIFRLFTYSNPKFIFNRSTQEAIFGNDFSIKIAAHDREFLIELCDKFNSVKKQRLGNSVVRTTAIFEDVKIEKTVQTLSPIIADYHVSGKRRYVDPYDLRWSEIILENLNGKIHAAKLCINNNLKVLPISRMKKRVVWYKGGTINGYLGTFSLSGNDAIINFVYHVGLGSSSSKGFGMIGPQC